MSVQLSYQSLGALPSNVGKPDYLKESLSAGIVHIGVGNFHRAHQAMYLHKLFNSGEALDWAIRGAGTKSFDVVMRKNLQQQDWLTTVVELDSEGLTAQVCASMIDFIENDTQSLIDALSLSEIRIVSLTITEGGYFMDDKMGGFKISDTEIQQDINNFSQPKTVFGIIIKALQYRRDNNIAPFTVMSCDNIPHNGSVTKRIICKMASKIDQKLADWIIDNVSFPNSMVDCITPATSNLEREKLTDLFAINDKAPVFCEPFRQWIMEDDFVNGRPPLEKVGVEFVENVEPFELMKLRILNGGHAAIAYPGALLGIHFVHQVMAKAMIRDYFRKLATEEIIPTLPDIPTVDFNQYLSLIESRFANPEVGDTVSRLCQDASNRLPKFILPIIQANLELGNDCKGLALVIALWCRLCAKAADPDSPIQIQDKQAKRLINQAILAKDNPPIFLQMGDIFGTLGNQDIFVQHFTNWLNMLWGVGTSNTLKHYLQ